MQQQQDEVQQIIVAAHAGLRMNDIDSKSRARVCLGTPNREPAYVLELQIESPRMSWNAKSRARVCLGAPNRESWSSNSRARLCLGVFHHI
jgi:hypothetical protein